MTIRKKKWLPLFLLLTLLMSLSACHPVEIGNAAVAAGLGLEWKNQEYTVSVQLAKPIDPSQPLPADQLPFEIVSARGATITEAARKSNLVLPHFQLWAQTNVFVMGENMCRHDAALFADFFSRNRNTRKSAIIAIAIGATPEEIMQAEAPLEPYSYPAIAKMLKIQEKQPGIYVPLTLGDFLFKLRTPGIEPLVPQVTLEKDEKGSFIKLDGAAVFKCHKMVGSLNERESRGYRWQTPGIIQGGIMDISSPFKGEKGLITLELTRSQAAIKPLLKDNKIIMEISLKAEGNYYGQDFSGEVLKLGMIKKIEETANKEIQHEIQLCIDKAQKLGSDIFGWGRMIEAAYPDLWQEIKEDWPDLFSRADTDIRVEFNIRRSYLTDSSFVFR